MARMPAAEWLGEHSPHTPMTRYDIVCVHTIVGFAPAHAAHFSTHANGRIDQSRDTDFRSAANLNGNHRVIAIENEDHGSPFPDWTGSNVPKLTDDQVDAIARILAWAHRTHGVPLQFCPDSRPESRGLAVHRQGIDGNFTLPDHTLGLPRSMWMGRVSGGEVWTETPGKVCPGDRRVAQIPEILTRAKGIVEGEWFEMATKAELQELLAEERPRIANAVWGENIGPDGSVDPARDRLRGADFQATEANTKVTALAAAFEEFRVGTLNRQKALVDRLKAIAEDTSDDATKAELAAVRDELLSAVAPPLA